MDRLCLYICLLWGVLVVADPVDRMSAKRYRSDTNYTINYFQQTVDHFSYGNDSSLTFVQRYLLNRDHWNTKGGPIFFYAGNEGDIELFAQNTGFMFEIAPEFGAMVVFAEHRYYGRSIPFGDQGYKDKKYYQYQSSMQALADYARLISYLKRKIPGAKDSPVVVFGGSYGGMLAAWMRIKYPNIVQGAIAASAPVAQFPGLTACDEFAKVVTNTFGRVSKECVNVIRQSWAAINQVTVDAKGKDWLSKTWKLCRPLKTTADVEQLKGYLNDVWTNLAMADYPYQANFLAFLPAYPVRELCQRMQMHDSAPGILGTLFEGLTVYFNYSTTAKCLEYGDAGPATLDSMGWDLQTCTEMVMPFCFNGKTDFFEPAAWNFTDFSKNCFNRWQTVPQPYKMEMMYGGRDLQGASNIVFSNGLLDPWSSGGVLYDQNPTVVSVIIPEGAHHLDLRSGERADPPSVRTARNIHRTNIRKWINEHHLNLNWVK